MKLPGQNSYIIAYWLSEADKRDYQPLYAAIKACGAWAHVSHDVWVVVTNQSATSIRNSLLKHMGVRDHLFVVKSGYEAAWQNVICTNQWLIDNL